MKVITVGRGNGNDIVISDPLISRVHLQLVKNDNGDCLVVDLGSKNGTFVNGQKITREVRLQPNDTIRIGNTMLPWQEYMNKSTMKINTSSASLGEDSHNTQVPPVEQPKKTSMVWLYVVLAVVLVLAIGVGSYCCYAYMESQKLLKEEQDRAAMEEQSRQEAEQKEQEYKRLQEQADDELYREALREERDANKKLAEKKQKELIEANKKADAAETKSKDATDAKLKAEGEAAKAEAKAQTAESAAAEAKEAEKKAKHEAEVAKQAAKTAAKRAELAEKFYEEYYAMSPKFAKLVCERLKVEIKEDDVKTSLKKLFDDGDNNKRQKVIDAIAYVKKQNDNTEIVGEAKVDTTTLKKPAKSDASSKTLDKSQSSSGNNE